MQKANLPVENIFTIFIWRTHKENMDLLSCETAEFSTV